MRLLGLAQQFACSTLISKKAKTIDTVQVESQDQEEGMSIEKEAKPKKQRKAPVKKFKDPAIIVPLNENPAKIPLLNVEPVTPFPRVNIVRFENELVQEWPRVIIDHTNTLEQLRKWTQSAIDAMKEPSKKRLLALTLTPVTGKSTALKRMLPSIIFQEMQNAGDFHLCIIDCACGPNYINATHEDLTEWFYSKMELWASREGIEVSTIQANHIYKKLDFLFERISQCGKPTFLLIDEFQRFCQYRELYHVKRGMEVFKKCLQLPNMSMAVASSGMICVLNGINKSSTSEFPLYERVVKVLLDSEVTPELGKFSADFLLNEFRATKLPSRPDYIEKMMQMSSKDVCSFLSEIGGARPSYISSTFNVLSKETFNLKGAHWVLGKNLMKEFQEDGMPILDHMPREFRRHLYRLGRGTQRTTIPELPSDPNTPVQDYKELYGIISPLIVSRRSLQEFDTFKFIGPFGILMSRFLTEGGDIHSDRYLYSDTKFSRNMFAQETEMRLSMINKHIERLNEEQQIEISKALLECILKYENQPAIGHCYSSTSVSSSSKSAAATGNTTTSSNSTTISPQQQQQTMDVSSDATLLLVNLKTYADWREWEPLKFLMEHRVNHLPNPYMTVFKTWEQANDEFHLKTMPLFYLKALRTAAGHPEKQHIEDKMEKRKPYYLWELIYICENYLSE